jgi:hypothetical protein
MNTNLVTIVKRIIAEQGETVLDNPRRMKAVFSDLAKEEPKPLRLAFGRCIEAGAYTALKNARDGQERREVKAAIAQRVRDEEGLDIAFCNDALNVLEAALFGELKTPRTSAAAPRPSSPPYREAPLQTEPRYQAWQSRQVIQPIPQKKSKLLLAAIIWQSVIVLLFFWLVIPIPTLIFTIKGWRKNDWKKIKIARLLYFLQVALICVSYIFMLETAELNLSASNGFFILLIPFVIVSIPGFGGPAILCAIYLARAKKNPRHIDINA